MAELTYEELYGKWSYDEDKMKVIAYLMEKEQVCPLDDEERWLLLKAN